MYYSDDFAAQVTYQPALTKTTGIARFGSWIRNGTSGLAKQVIGRFSRLKFTRSSQNVQTPVESKITIASDVSKSSVASGIQKGSLAQSSLFQTSTKVNSAKPNSRENSPQTEPNSRENSPQTEPNSRENIPKTEPNSRENNPETEPNSRENNPKTEPNSRENNSEREPNSSENSHKTNGNATPKGKDDRKSSLTGKISRRRDTTPHRKVKPRRSHSRQSILSNRSSRSNHSIAI